MLYIYIYSLAEYNSEFCYWLGMIGKDVNTNADIDQTLTLCKHCSKGLPVLSI